MTNPIDPEQLIRQARESAAALFPEELAARSAYECELLHTRIRELCCMLNATPLD